MYYTEQSVQRAVGAIGAILIAAMMVFLAEIADAQLPEKAATLEPWRFYAWVTGTAGLILSLDALFFACLVGFCGQFKRAGDSTAS